MNNAGVCCVLPDCLLDPSSGWVGGITIVDGCARVPRSILTLPHPQSSLHSVRDGLLSCTVLNYLTQGRPWPKYLFFVPPKYTRKSSSFLLWYNATFEKEVQRIEYKVIVRLCVFLKRM